MSIGYNPFDEDFSIEEFHEYRAMAYSLREENLRLKRKMDELKKENNFLHATIQNAEPYRQGCKDTAKEIYGEIDDNDILVVETKEYGEIEVVPMERLKEIIKNKGVEVE